MIVLPITLMAISAMQKTLLQRNALLQKTPKKQQLPLYVARALFKNIHKTSVFLNKVDETTYPSFPVSFHLV